MSKRNDNKHNAQNISTSSNPQPFVSARKRAVRRQAELDLINVWRLAALFYPNIKVPKLPTEVR
jgi:hypothetical protein